jgi:hypothetical protein
VPCGPTAVVDYYFQFQDYPARIHTILLRVDLRVQNVDMLTCSCSLENTKHYIDLLYFHKGRSDSIQMRRSSCFQEYSLLTQLRCDLCVVEVLPSHKMHLFPFRCGTVHTMFVDIKAGAVGYLAVLQLQSVHRSGEISFLHPHFLCMLGFLTSATVSITAELVCSNLENGAKMVS